MHPLLITVSKHQPITPPVAKLVHFHGFSDHIDNYFDFFPALARHGILCTAIDQRGWGRTAQKNSDRGNTGPTPFILADMAALIESQLAAPPSDIPVFIMGHSMGGGLVATLASTPEYQPLVSRLGGIMLEAPFIGLTPEQAPYAITVYAGRLFGWLLPWFQISAKMPADRLVRDPAVREVLRTNPLCHGVGTLEMFANMLDRAANLSSGRLVLNEGVKSVFVAHGTADRCTSRDASKNWFDMQTGRVSDRQFKDYEGWSHLLHADLPENRQKFADDIAAWILERSK